jgi:uncharacterized protein YjbI with pentapeptide repeats
MSNPDLLPNPQKDDLNGWREYWQKKGQPWRTEPEIDASRQQFLAERRTIIPDIEKGIYPFKEVKLCRADVEWLLATHDNGRGPVDWSEINQRKRDGLDLRGAEMCEIDLCDLPLARVHLGLTPAEWFATKEDCQQREMAATHLENAKLWGTHLEGAFARRAYFEGALLHWARLEEANFRAANFKDADLREAHLEGTHLPEANLERVNLRGAFFDAATDLEHIIFEKEVMLADIHWNNINLSTINWRSINQLGDEHLAYQNNKIDDFRTALRANRQLAVALQAQGINEDAARFAYRANMLQKRVYRLEMLQQNNNFTQRLLLFLSYLFSWFLFLIAGYGYRPGRTLLWYLLVICGFAVAYSRAGGLPLLPDALVFSIMSFHGRGFFPSLNGASSLTLHSLQIVLAAAEAIIGLLIEISFIATFTQRFFGK